MRQPATHIRQTPSDRWLSLPDNNLIDTSQESGSHMPGISFPPDPAPAADGVSRLFDQWAESGRSEHLEREHSKTVLKFLGGIRFRDSFSFLDVGCGNGWVVRRVAQMGSCRRAVGIDKSQGMIKKAVSRRQSGKESYRATDVESVRSGRFDYVFSMETIYYAASVEAAVRKIYRLLKPGGVFFCGTDFYSDNRATNRWAGTCPVKVHLLSRSEWRSLFEDAGFETRTTQVKDEDERRRWKREQGTLFIVGTRPVP